MRGKIREKEKEKRRTKEGRRESLPARSLSSACSRETQKAKRERG